MSVDEARALTVDARIDAWRDAALPLVVRWEWYSFAFHSLTPGTLRLDGIRPGKRIATPTDDAPAPPRSHGYGFDQADRLVALHQHMSGGRFEHYRRHERDVVATVCFHHTAGRAWVNASWHSLVERRVDLVYAAGGWRTHRYAYDDAGRIIVRETTALEPNGMETHAFCDLEYDAKGKLARMYSRTSEGRRSRSWPRR